MGELEARLTDAEKERDCLQRQLAASLPQVKFQRKVEGSITIFLLLIGMYRNWRR